MPAPVKAMATHPYATQIPGRNKPFKTHRTFGQAKAALSLYLERDPNRARYGYQQLDDGLYTQDMTVYRLNADSGEYESWIEVKRSDRRSQHPELMPQRKRTAYTPSDEHERATAVATVSALRWPCYCPTDTHKPWCLAVAKITLLTQLGADQ